MLPLDPLRPLGGSKSPRTTEKRDDSLMLYLRRRGVFSTRILVLGCQWTRAETEKVRVEVGQAIKEIDLIASTSAGRRYNTRYNTTASSSAQSRVDVPLRFMSATLIVTSRRCF